MSNGVAKLLDGSPKAWEIDLLSDFYRAWFDLHKYRATLKGKDRSEDEQETIAGMAQEIVDAHVAIQYYRGRHERR